MIIEKYSIFRHLMFIFENGRDPKKAWKISLHI